MSYQFPPPKQDKTKDLIQLAASVVVGSLFFASPIGGFVLGIFNSFLLLVLGLPILAIAGFAVWQSVNTLSGECPNCGAPATVLKRRNGSTTNNDIASQQQQQPSICFNCASVLQANADNTGIENVTGRTTLQDLESSSSSVGGGSSFFDGLFGGTTSSRDPDEDDVFVTQSKASSKNSSNRKPKKEESVDIIDVEVESKNDDTTTTPWQ